MQSACIANTARFVAHADARLAAFSREANRPYCAISLRKRRRETQLDVYRAMLGCVPGINSHRANAVVAQLPAMGALLRAYADCGSQEERDKVAMAAAGGKTNAAAMAKCHCGAGNEPVT